MTIKKTTSGLQVNNSAPNRPAAPTPAPATPPESKATLQSKPASPKRLSLQIFRPRRVEPRSARHSVDVGVLNRANGVSGPSSAPPTVNELLALIDHSPLSNGARGSAEPKGKQFDLNETLYELGFAYAGKKDARSEWDAQRKANSGRASDKIQGEPRQRAESRGQKLPPPNDPPLGPPPPLHQKANPDVASDKTQNEPGQPTEFAARPPPADQPPPLPPLRQAATPETAVGRTLSEPGQTTESGAVNRRLPAPPPPLVLRQLPPEVETDVTKMLSTLANRQPRKLPPLPTLALPPERLAQHPSLAVKASSETQSLLPTDLQVTNALTLMDVEIKKVESGLSVESAFGRTAPVLNEASAKLRPLEKSVVDAKQELERAEQVVQAPKQLPIAEKQVVEEKKKLASADKERDEAKKQLETAKRKSQSKEKASSAEKKVSEATEQLKSAEEKCMLARVRLRGAEIAVAANKEMVSEEQQKDAVSQLKAAQAKLKAAETRHDAVAKYLHEFTAGRLDTRDVKRAVAEAKQLVQSYEKLVAQGEAKDARMAKAMLELARVDLQAAEAQEKIADDASKEGINEEWKQELLGKVPEQLRGLADVATKMSLAVGARDAWLRDWPASRKNELPKVKNGLAVGATILMRLPMFMKDLVERATKGDDVAPLIGTQNELEAFLGKKSSALLQINEAITALSELKDPEAIDFRKDLERLVVELQDPNGAPQQLLLIARANPNQVRELARPLWVSPAPPQTT